MYEVDLEYPKELHDYHKDYSLLPEMLKENNKLTANVYDKNFIF